MPKRPTAILITLLVFAGLYAASRYNYLLFHALTELFSIIIGCGIFMVAWNARRYLTTHYLLFIGIGYLSVSTLDLVHTLSYAGMNIISGYGANAPTQLWIAARYTESLTLLAAPLMFNRRLRSGVFFLAYGLIVAGALLAVFRWRIFPNCYFTPAGGLTPFKITSEYVICLILLGAGIHLWYRRAYVEASVLKLLMLSIVVTILAEVAFTRYASVFGLSNLIGHCLKIVSFYLIYKAVIETGLKKPYDLLFRDLGQQREHLRVTLESIGDAVIATDGGGRVTFLNRMAESLTGWSMPEAIGAPAKTVFDVVDAVARTKNGDPVSDLLQGRIPSEKSDHLLLRPKAGGEVSVSSSAAPIQDASGKIEGVVLAFHDITERKRAEAALRASRERIEASLAEKNVMLKEIHHRVKNNLQVISSLVSLQTNDVSDSTMSGILADLTHRIRSMALVHEMLYQSVDMAQVAFDHYAQSLLCYLWRAHSAEASGIRLATELAPIALPVNTAVPCGLILNELVTNALKHAFDGHRDGQVSVSLYGDAHRRVHLRVQDNGVGLPADMDWQTTGSLGLRLVNMLSQQIGATVNVSNARGTTFLLAFDNQTS